MRVLVTGGSGFVGAVLARHLQRHGHEVVVLLRPAARGAAAAVRRAADDPRAPGPGMQVVHADLRDKRQVDGAMTWAAPEAVVHLAALTRARESQLDPVGSYDVNVNGTVHLLSAMDDAARTTGRPARLVFASTAAVYGSAEGYVDEDAPLAPVHPYAAGKLAAETLVSHQAATGRLGAVTLRCFNIAGAANGVVDEDFSRLIPKTLAVAAGLAPELTIHGDGGARREYTHVLDVVEAYRLALEAAEPGRNLVLNVGSGAGVSVSDVVDTVARVTGRPVPVVHAPAAAEPHTLVADGRRITAELGWSPTRSGIDEIVHDGWREAYAEVEPTL